MPLENVGSHIDEWLSLKKSPEYIKELDERVKKVEQDENNYKQLVKVNDVLNVLDFPDNQEEAFRKVLEKQNQATLKELVWKSKNEIVVFLTNANYKETNQETEKQNMKYEKIEQKLSKIKSVFSTEILNNNPDIAQNFEALKQAQTPEQKEAILQEILSILKEPWKLKSIIDSLGWADKNNPKYVEFKNSLVWVDSSFESYFNDLENLNTWVSLNTNEVINSIEKDSWWVVKIDLSSDSPMSKMSLIWSSYSFDEKIDKKTLSKINENSQEQLNDVRDSFLVLKAFGASFDVFLNAVRENFWKEDFKEKLKGAIANFSKDIFSDLDDVYKSTDVKVDEQIKESDISSFADINSPNDLKLKIENIKEKFLKIKSKLWDTQAWILKNYQTQMKELLEMESKQKEKQLKVLEFMKNSGFDLIPKEITNRIIRELQSNTLVIPWLDLNVKNIDLKNWNFWESWAFIDKEAWINSLSKTNIVKFLNKIISWNLDEPLSVEAIANWISVANPAFLKGKFLEADIVSNIGWKYNKIIENLKKSL